MNRQTNKQKEKLPKVNQNFAKISNQSMSPRGKYKILSSPDCFSEFRPSSSQHLLLLRPLKHKPCPLPPTMCTFQKKTSISIRYNDGCTSNPALVRTAESGLIQYLNVFFTSSSILLMGSLCVRTIDDLCELHEDPIFEWIGGCWVNGQMTDFKISL